MKIKSKSLAVIVMVFIFGSIALTSALGLWKTTNDKTPAKYKNGEFAGRYDPADIRGSYTFGDIANAFEVPAEDLGRAFRVQYPSKYETFQCNELETMYAYLSAEGKEVGTDSVRYFVALYKGLPITVEENTYLPKTAVDILKSKAKLTAEQISTLEKHTVETEKQTVPAASTGSKQSPAVTVTIKGTMTFQELLDLGVSRDDIEKVINDKLTDPNVTLKDYASSKGIEFSAIKESLQILADKLER